MIAIGDKIRFIPSAWEECPRALPRPDWKLRDVLGTVTYINAAHGYYRVTYELDSFGVRVVGHECFKIPAPPTAEQPEKAQKMYNTFGRREAARQKKSREGQK